ncbi:M48 family metalloprotease [Micromonospora sp. NPDC049257]|uniref:M48 family metalloprotease n=1 Tax=Micromonospora sp. NPDC049257 TaxID=3155771 RepID=UPI003412BBF5
MMSTVAEGGRGPAGPAGATTPPPPSATPPLPSATLGRFVAAVTAVVGTSMFGWSTVLVDGDATRVRAECLADVLRTRPFPIDARAGTVDETGLAAIRRCTAGLGPDVAGQLLAGLAVLLAVTMLAYLVAPWCECRLRGLRRLDRVPGTQALRADLAELVGVAGLRRSPTFVVSRSARISGNTFGAGPLRYVRLDLGLVHAHRVAPRVFRAVVLHELAHVRNSDIHLTRLTIAQAWAFPLGVLVPVTVTYLRADAGRQLLADSWRLAAFALVVQVSAWSVLRAREFTADARLPAADADAVRALLAADHRQVGRWARLGALFRFHPLARARADALDRPGRRFAARPVEALGAGLAAGIAAPSVRDLATSLPRVLPGADPVTDSAFVTGILLGVPLALVATGALWRAAWWARHTGRPVASGAAFGAALACGLLVGRRLAWRVAYATDLRAWWIEVLLAGPWIAGGALLGRWVADGARAHLRHLAAAAVTRIRWAWAGAAVATSVLTAGYVATLLVLDAWSTDDGWSMLHLVAAREGTGAATPLTLLDMIGFYVRITAASAPYLIALPLLAALFPVLAGRGATRRALRTGVAVGVAGALVLPLVPLGVGAAVRDPGLATATAATLVTSHTLLPVTFVEVGVAVAAVATRRLSLSHALLAALTAGALMTPAVVVADVLVSCVAGAPGCAPAVDPTVVVRALTHALLVAPVAAVLAAAVGTAVPAALAVLGRRRWWPAVVVPVLLVAAGAVAVTPHRPTPVGDRGRDPCLVGVWRLVAGRFHEPVAPDSPLGVLTGLHTDGALDLSSGPAGGHATAYRADGTATDLYDLFVAEGTLNGHTVRSVQRGTVTYRWSAGNGRYAQRDQVAASDRVLRVDDRELPLTGPAEDFGGSYRCTADQLVITTADDAGSHTEQTFVRSPT